MNRYRPSPRALTALIVLHVLVTAVTWRDIGRRRDDQVRGSKRMWRIFSAAQMGNSLVYWLVGRRRIA